MKNFPWNLIILILLGLFWWNTAVDMALLMYGELATARVIHVTQHSGRHTTYSAFYEFTTSDKTVAHGNCSCSKNAEGKTIKILYLSAFPGINEPANRITRITSIVCWGLLGWVTGVFLFHPKMKSAVTESVLKSQSLRTNRWMRSLLIGGILAGVSLLLLSPQTQPVWNIFNGSNSGTPIPTIPIQESMISRGNAIGNPENGNSFARFNDQIFFHQWTDYNAVHSQKQGLYCCPIDSKAGIPNPVNQSGQTNDIYKGIAAYDGWIYYTLMKGLARIQADGSRKQVLIKDRITSFAIVNGTLFYQIEYDSQRIYRSKLNGSRQKRLCMEETGLFSVAGDGWIYYTNLTDHGTLFRMREDGNHRQIIRDILPEQIIAESDRCWYIDKTDHKLKYWEAASDHVEIVCDQPVQAFSFSGSQIVMVSDRKFYKLDPQHGIPVFIAHSLAEYYDFSIFEDRIYQRAGSSGFGPVVSIGLNENQWVYITESP